jgi:DNA-binding cell septation regulator SpoVG
MKIVNLYKIPNTPGRIKATFSIDFGILLIRDCKLISGQDGDLWAAMPNRSYMENGQKKFAGIVQIKDTKIMDVITNAARELFESGGMSGVEYEI